MSRWTGRTQSSLGYGQGEGACLEDAAEGIEKAGLEKVPSRVFLGILGNHVDFVLVHESKHRGRKLTSLLTSANCHGRGRGRIRGRIHLISE